MAQRAKPSANVFGHSTAPGEKKEPAAVSRPVRQGASREHPATVARLGISPEFQGTENDRRQRYVDLKGAKR